MSASGSTELQDSQSIGIVGLGLLGRGIATCLLANNVRTVVFDEQPDAVARLIPHASAVMDQLVTRGGLPEQMRDTWRSRLVVASNLQEFAECGFVIESIVEDFAAKQTLFDRLEEIVEDTVPIASNTSALPISKQQEHRRIPERFIGMHWAEPCHLTRFLEVIRGKQTSDEVVARTLQLGIRLGKDPTVVRKDVPGFIVNRLAYALYREAFWLLENDVADVADIDRAFSAAISVWGDVAGPFRWMDLTGVAAYGRVMEHLLPELSRSTEVPEKMRQLMAENAQGISTRQGFYHYSEDEVRHWEQTLIENVWKNRTAVP